jgi:hypothetical protein
MSTTAVKVVEIVEIVEVVVVMTGRTTAAVVGVSLTTARGSTTAGGSTYPRRKSESGHWGYGDCSGRSGCCGCCC